MLTRSTAAYGTLVVLLAVILVWQTLEHKRVKETARAALIGRARDISSTVSLVVRSQGFRGVVLQQFLERALQELVQAEQITSIALLNPAREVVVSAGAPIKAPEGGFTDPEFERWDRATVMLMNLVDLDRGEPNEREPRPTIMITNANALRPPGDRRRDPNRTNQLTNPDPSRPPEGASPRRGPGGPRREAEFRSYLERHGQRLHSFVIVMSTEPFRVACVNDLWLRMIISGFATLAVFGLGLAWRNLKRSSELQMRLVRASELNSHLREMNVAAAGLAHETRNPLNIIRGLAQLISKDAAASTEVRERVLAITTEVDRITAQLNEFIHYSRPREVRSTPVSLNSVISDVVRALQSDIEDKQIQLIRKDEDLMIGADEALLRQVMFNLVMNAIQAVNLNGSITVAAGKTNSSEAWFEVRDDGPGVPPEFRQEIFRPYFTTQKKGTGLGLAVVQQIVLAHGWEVSYHANSPQGAIFRIAGVQCHK